MKMLPYLLINLVMVGGGIAAYDHLKADDASPHADTGGMDEIDLQQVEDRIVDRLNSGNQPMLRASGTDPKLVARIAALEKQLGSASVVESAGDAGGSTTTASNGEGLAMPSLSEGSDVEPSDDEVKRFRKIMERAEQQRREEREAERMDQMLARLEINLDAGQKKKLMGAQRDYRRKVGETMREAFRGGGGREAAREAMDGLREEYQTVLVEFMSVGDAQKIVEAGGGMRGMMRGRDGGGAGRRGR